jgi:hypothetical protein
MKYTQLVAAFSNVNGTNFIGLDTLTEVKLLGGKKNPQQGRITKKMTGASVMVFSNQNTNAYKAMVERRLVAEGKDPAGFELHERAWGTRIPNMPIVQHEKDGEVKYYLEVVFLKPGTVEYRQDGLPIAKADIEGLQESKGGEQGGLTNKVIIRDFAADSIVEVRIDGKVFN